MPTEGDSANDQVESLSVENEVEATEFVDAQGNRVSDFLTLGGESGGGTNPNADVTFIEDFEDDNPLAGYSGSGWTLQTDVALDGEQSIAMTSSGRDNRIYRDGSGDPNSDVPTIEPGNAYEVRFKAGGYSNENNPAIFFHAQPDGSGGWNQYRFSTGSDGSRMYLFTPSGNTALDRGLGGVMPTGTWLALRVDLIEWPVIEVSIIDSDGTVIRSASHDTSGDSNQQSTGAYGFGDDCSGEDLYLDSLVRNPDQSGYVPGASTGGTTVSASVDGEDIRPRSIGRGDLYITEFPGDDLGERVNAALEYMDATGYDATIRIPDKGTSWNWSTPVTHRVDNRQDSLGATTDRLGIDIQAGANAKINYSGDDFMLTIKKAFGKVNIEGGWWTCSGDPKGWLRLKDVSRGFFHPLFVDFRTSNSTDHSNDADEPRDVTGAVCVSMENHGGWCELNTFEGWFKGDNGLDTRHGDQTAGSGGTESFQSTSIRDSYFHTHEAGGFGFRLRGNHQYCSYRGLRFHINAENGRGLVINSSTTWPYKAPFHDCKFENNDYSSGEIAIYATANYDAYYPVSFNNMHISSSIETDYEHVSTDGQWSVGGLAPGSSKLRFKAEEGRLWITDSDGNTTWSA